MTIHAVNQILAPNQMTKILQKHLNVIVDVYFDQEMVSGIIRRSAK